MRIKAMALTLAIAAMTATVPAAAQDIKIGVVNYAQLVLQSPQAQRVREKIQEQFSARQEELQAKQEELEADVERLQRDGSVMSAEASQQLQDSIRERQRRLQFEQSEYQEDVEKVRQRELEALHVDVQTAVRSFAEEQNYDVIVGEGVLYATDQVNVTGQILQRLQNGN